MPMVTAKGGDASPAVCSGNLLSPFLNGHLMAPSQSTPLASPPTSTPTSSRLPKSNLPGENDVIKPKDQVYSCPLCPEVLQSQHDFTAHIRGHNDVKPQPDPNDPTGQAKVYYCCLCNKMLSSFSSLDRHMLVHSGERPFSCELCGQTFTTNGNMHRHKRTHGTRDSRESDASSGDSGASAKKAARKRKPGNAPVFPAKLTKEKSSKDNDELLNEWSKLKKPSASSNSSLMANSRLLTDSNNVNRSAAELAKELSRGLKCDECPMVFPDMNFLKLHKSIYHHKSFASFPAFPMAHTLMEAKSNFERKEPTLPTSMPALDLSPVKLFPNALRLGANLNNLASEPNTRASLSPASQDRPSSALLSDMESQHDEMEGVLREMKLKGEFPCRLCPAVYPNLRALKGHIKEHMSKPPFRCNVGKCTYWSNDKNALTQHMRLHTGDKPFECRECNFGFTTKANCERHVKNKHGKVLRDEIRDSIVIHEGDEQSQDRLNRSLDNTEAQSPKATPPILATPPMMGPRPLFAPYSDSLFRAPNPEEARTDSPLDLSKSNLETKSSNDELLRDSIAGAWFNSLQPSLGLNCLMKPVMPLPLLFAAASANSTDMTTAYLQELVRRQNAIKEGSVPLLDQLNRLQSAFQLAQQTSTSTEEKFCHKNTSSDPKIEGQPDIRIECQSNESHEDATIEEDNGEELKNESQEEKPLNESNNSSNNSSMMSECPFKCHLCDDSFAERQEAIVHLKRAHAEEYEVLFSKGAFDNETVNGTNNVNNDGQGATRSGSCEDLSDCVENGRGRLPDYVNRKVMCLFCMRKFWSAEDLRRHVRTHTGERPYECDVCQRRFTLKHSMLRHRKKHDDNNEDSDDNENNNNNNNHGVMEAKERKRANLMDKINRLSALTALDVGTKL